MKTRKLLSVTTTVAAIAMVGLALSGCTSSSKGASTGIQTDSGGKITVWVDAPRVPAADAFKKAEPATR